jgi:hypothetical protein
MTFDENHKFVPFDELRMTNLFSYSAIPYVFFLAAT